MPILDVQDITEGGSYTAAAGSNRLVVIAGNGESAFSSRPIVGISMGGAAFTLAAEAVDDSASKGGVWYIKEADIPTGAQTITVNWKRQTHDTFIGSIYTLGGMDQDSPVFDTATDQQDGVSALPLAINAIDGGVLVCEAGTNSQTVAFDGTATVSNSTIGLTVDRAAAAPSHYTGVVSAEPTASQAETVDLRFAASTNTTGAAAMFAPFGSTQAITLSGPLTPGATITATLTGFSSYPTEVTITDSAANSIVRSLTQVSGDDHTFTVPALPSGGGAASILLFGPVTVTAIDNAPTLTSPSASSPGAGAIDGSISTNEMGGTLYYLASANASENVATVKAGSSQAVSATGPQSVSLTGLSTGTYYLHFVHTDAGGQNSSVASTTSVSVA